MDFLRFDFGIIVVFDHNSLRNMDISQEREKENETEDGEGKEGASRHFWSCRTTAVHGVTDDEITLDCLK